jgi:hypothetical protein
VKIDLLPNKKLQQAMAESDVAESDNMFEFDQSDKEPKQPTPSNADNLENMVIITTNILKSSENKKEV